MNKAFERFWATQDTGLGYAHKLTAWNAWLAGTKAEREMCIEIATNHECGGEDDIICRGKNCGACIAGAIQLRATQPQSVTVAMPLHLTPKMLQAVREDDTTRIENFDEWHRRMGWLICAWDILVAELTKTPNAHSAGAERPLERGLGKGE